LLNVGLVYLQVRIFSVGDGGENGKNSK